MKEKTLISVVVPIYNVEKYLERCIDSIINQTYKNLEILLINDGSKDSSYEICKNVEKKDKRIKVYSKENGGLSDARNYGLERAKGEYICFIDSDDYINPKMIEKLYEQIKEKNSDIAIVHYNIVNDGEENNQEITDLKEDTYVYNSESAIRQLFYEDYYRDFAWNKLYKKSLFKNIRYPFGKLMEDLGTTYLLFDNSEKISYSKLPLYYYVQREGSILNKKNLKLEIDKTELGIKRYEYILNKYPYMEENKIFTYNLLVQNYHLIYNNQELVKKAKAILKKWNISIFSKLNLKNKIKYMMISINEKLYVKRRNSERK